MDISTKQGGNYVVISPKGNINGETAPEVESVIMSELESTSNVVLNMSGVEFMSSAGLRVMLQLSRQIAARDGKAVLVGLGDSIREVMEITGFLSFFEMAEDEADAVSRFSAST